MSDENATCVQCRFWQANRYNQVYKGSCCRMPPQILPLASSQIGNEEGDEFSAWEATHFPVTMYDDWCGEFQPKPADAPPEALPKQ